MLSASEAPLHTLTGHVSRSSIRTTEPLYLIHLLRYHHERKMCNWKLIKKIHIFSWEPCFSQTSRHRLKFGLLSPNLSHLVCPCPACFSCCILCMDHFWRIGSIGLMSPSQSAVAQRRCKDHFEPEWIGLSWLRRKWNGTTTPSTSAEQSWGHVPVLCFERPESTSFICTSRPHHSALICVEHSGLVENVFTIWTNRRDERHILREDGCLPQYGGSGRLLRHTTEEFCSSPPEADASSVFCVRSLVKNGQMVCRARASSPQASLE